MLIYIISKTIHLNTTQKIYKEIATENNIKEGNEIVEIVDTIVKTQKYYQNFINQEFNLTKQLINDGKNLLINFHFLKTINEKELNLINIQDIIPVDEISFRYLFYTHSSEEIIKEFLFKCFNQGKFSKFFLVQILQIKNMIVS